MGRHGMKYCLICNPSDNGMRGDEGTEAIGRYYLPRHPDSAHSGWIPVCEHCVPSFSQYHEIEPLKGFEDHKLFKKEGVEEGPYEHIWRKANLVTIHNPGGQMYDLMRCEKCREEAKRFGLGEEIPTKGCTVEGLVA